jgi:hypothetical protein
VDEDVSDQDLESSEEVAVVLVLYLLEDADLGDAVTARDLMVLEMGVDEQDHEGETFRPCLDPCVWVVGTTEMEPLR